MKDEGHTRLAWPPHSYENINFIKEHYESMPVSSQMVEETRPISTLHHKGQFPYQYTYGSRTFEGILNIVVRSRYERDLDRPQ